jgi:hypothetical protein
VITSSAAAVVVAILLLLTAGYGLVALVARQMAMYWFERWAASYLIGMASLSVVWIISSVLIPTIHPIWLTSGCSAALGLAAYRRCTVARPGDRPSLEASVGTCAFQWPDVILASILSLEFLSLTVASWRSSLGFDGVFNFELKARLMFEHSSGQLPLAYLSDVSRAWSHPQYPLMVPFGELWVYTWLGRVDQAAIKMLFPLFFFALVAFVCGAVRRVAGGRIALASGVGLGLMPPLTLLPGAASGYADVPLAAAVAGSVAFTFHALRKGDSEAVTVAGLLLAVATWTKAEGVVIAGTLGVLGVLCLRLQEREQAPSISLRHSLVLLWMPSVAAVCWLVVQYRYGIPAPDFVPLSARSVLDNAERLPIIADLIVRELVRPGHWGLVWPASAIAVVLAAGRQQGLIASDRFLVGAIYFPLILYTLPFMLSSWADVGEHVRSALPRLLVPLSPVALLFTVVTFCRRSYA